MDNRKIKAEKPELTLGQIGAIIDKVEGSTPSVKNFGLTPEGHASIQKYNSQHPGENPLPDFSLGINKKG